MNIEAYRFSEADDRANHFDKLGEKMYHMYIVSCSADLIMVENAPAFLGN